MRRQRRAERLKEEQDKARGRAVITGQYPRVITVGRGQVKYGLAEAPAPKVKISNLMRVLGERGGGGAGRGGAGG